MRASTIARSVRPARQAASARAERAHEPRAIHARSGHEAALEPLQQEDAREPLPLAVRLEQLGGLARLGPASAQRGEELDEAEVVDEPGVVAAEPLERDRRRPSTGRRRARGRGARARPGVARSPSRSSVRASRVSVAARLAASPQRGESRGREPRERLARRRILAARADDRALDLERLDAWMSCPQTARSAACVTVALRRGRIPRRRCTDGPSSGSRAKRRWNSLVSSSSASMKRASSIARSHEARTTTRPSWSCCADAQRPPAGAPSRSLVPAVSRSEYGPAARSTASTIGASLLGDPWLTRYLRAMRLVDAVSLRSRERKLRLFLDELQPTAETTVLDVGADELGFGEGDGCGTLNFFEEHYPWPERITALGLHDGAGFRARYPEIPYVQGDACALPFADGEFDIVFSNAVIEHVGGRERQRQLVSEAIRVGRRVFITTPNRRFPIEVHTRLPLVHWLPDRSRAPRLSRGREGVRDRRPPALRGGASRRSSPGASASSASG